MALLTFETIVWVYEVEAAFIKLWSKCFCCFISDVFETAQSHEVMEECFMQIIVLTMVRGMMH